MDWKQELLKRLDVLAEKLGTTAAYLWTVLVRQAYADGIEWIAFALFFAVAVVAAYKFSNRCFAYAQTKKDEWNASDFRVGGYVLIAIAFILAAISLAFAVEGTLHFVNPSYYALHEVLDTLGK